MRRRGRPPDMVVDVADERGNATPTTYVIRELGQSFLVVVAELKGVTKTNE